MRCVLMPTSVGKVCNLISAYVCGHFEGLFDYFLLLLVHCPLHLCSRC